MLVAVILIAVVVAMAALLALMALIVKVYGKELFFTGSKGEFGENVVARILGDTVSGEQYVINDLLFKNESGQSCQIDHVFINKFGIWVIETKNRAGDIYGEENRREWIQVLGRGDIKNAFYNPVKQNATHIYHLSKYLKVKNIFMNVVVFLPRADISNVTSANVYSVDELQTIKSKATDITLSVGQMEYYYNKLTELKAKANISKEEHVEHIHEMQDRIQRGICPRCGGKLVMRAGRNGDYLGCSNYPKCKFTKDVE